MVRLPKKSSKQSRYFEMGTLAEAGTQLLGLPSSQRGGSAWRCIDSWAFLSGHVRMWTQSNHLLTEISSNCALAAHHSSEPMVGSIHVSIRFHKINSFFSAGNNSRVSILFLFLPPSNWLLLETFQRCRSLGSRLACTIMLMVIRLTGSLLMEVVPHSQTSLTLHAVTLLFHIIIYAISFGMMWLRK